ncbi:hypothetical protein C7450_103105 [Chelatococcus asaccharovorans]|uniref:Uncharacterized protein n=2 Tax=Chelatococcus asaccharovorans TaxID=28210 RepID=A0A2V3UBU5_9HYPH|nr:hypothetical protein C7450_103105 [Chelatococcus asaccharovorans]
MNDTPADTAAPRIIVTADVLREILERQPGLEVEIARSAIAKIAATIERRFDAPNRDVVDTIQSRIIEKVELDIRSRLREYMMPKIEEIAAQVVKQRLNEIIAERFQKEADKLREELSRQFNARFGRMAAALHHSKDRAE